LILGNARFVAPKTLGICGNERLETSAVLRTEATGETRGVMNALVGNDDCILGLTMLDGEAGEVKTVVQKAMLANLPNAQLRDALIARRTISEGLDAPLSNVQARSGA
jgi:pyruvate/2-oxoglutarate dehydrogenase complex dihydrolipoamide dehydrogenase (E3) component